MEVKEEPVDTEYRSCQFETSDPNQSTTGEIMAICPTTESVPTEVFTYVDTLNNNNTTENQLTLNSNITDDQLVTKNVVTDTPPPSNNDLNQLPVSETPPKTPQTTSMSHALPQRIAQIQRRLQPDQTYRNTLAQPKDNNDNRHAVCRKWRNGSSFVKNVRQVAQSNYIAKKQIDKQFPSETVESDSINPSKPTSKSKDITISGEKDNGMSQKLKNGRTKGVDSAMEGLFGWTLIDNIFIPYIFRADNQKYVCVRLLEHKLLCKYPNIFPEELAVREPLTSSFIKSSECKVFNQLVRMQYKDSKDIITFNNEDVVVLLSEFLSFYDIVKKTFPDFTQAETNQSMSVENKKSGWMQINNTIIPYIYRSQEKLLPLAVLKHAASIDIETNGVQPTVEECTELNHRCTEEGFRFTFKLSSNLVSLSLIQKFFDVSITELPDKDPLQHAQYLLEDGPVSEGLSNTTHTNAHPTHPAHHLQQLSLQTTNQNLTDCFNNGLQQPIVFAYNKDPTSLQHGSPNVTIVPRHTSPLVPRHRLQQPFNAANVIHRFPNTLVPNMNQTYIQNRMPLAIHNDRYIRTERQQRTSVEQEEYSHEDINSFNIHKNVNSNDQPLIPGSIMNVLPQGQNINVNYGINIQNITPTHQLSTGHVTHHTPTMGRNAHCTTVQSVPMTTPSIGTNVHCTTVQSVPMTTPSIGTHVHCTTGQSVPMNIQNTNINHQSTTLTDQAAMKFKHKIQNNKEETSRQQDNVVCIQEEGSYHLRQKHAIKELITCIRGVWLGGKNISCLHLSKPGRSGRFCLVEAICKLFYRNRTVNEFLFTIDKVLVTSACTDLEEQAFIEYYQLPVKVLKCNKMVELAAFEKLFPQLTEILTGNFPQYYTPPNTRCPYPLPESMKRRSIQTGTTWGQTNQSNDKKGEEDKVIVLDN